MRDGWWLGRIPHPASRISLKRHSASERLFHARLGALPDQRPRTARHRHLPRPAVRVGGPLLHDVSALPLLAAHEGFAFPLPGGADELTVRGVSHTGVDYAIIRVALPLRAIAQDAQPLHRSARAGAIRAAHEVEAALEP